MLRELLCLTSSVSSSGVYFFVSLRLMLDAASPYLALLGISNNESASRKELSSLVVSRIAN